jgi:undecaprenyl-diphosphatase
MNLIQAIILGIVQGLTEFIPISSSGHLILAGRAMGLDRTLAPEEITALIAVLQLGTLAAVVIYFLTDIIGITKGFIYGNLGWLGGRRTAKLPETARLGWLIIIGTIPVAAVGLLAKEIIEGALTKNLTVISVSMLVWAVLLGLAEWLGMQRKDFKDLGAREAVIVGLGQVFALIPGSSRSGTTIACALFAGIKREAAARFSFLLSIPAIAASGLLELKEAVQYFSALGAFNLLAGVLASAVVGYASIAFLLNYLRQHTTGIFIVYRLIVGAWILGMIYLGMLKP